MVYFGIDVHVDTFEGDGFIRKPQISVFDTTFLGAVNQIRDILSNKARISFVYVWYIGRKEVGDNEVLSYNYYNEKNFIAMIKKVLGEDLI